MPALFLKKPLCTGDLLPTCKIIIERPVKTSAGAKLLPDVTGVLKLSSDNLLDFHAKILSVPVNVWEYLTG